jgi:three-Cys-motif partner protein
MWDTMNICSNCNGKNRDAAGLCEKELGSDGLPVLCVGPWAEKKHHYLESYCHISSDGMKNRWGRRFYIDLFSGPGLCRNKESSEEIDGSPLIALSKNFTDFIFIESNRKSLDVLKSRVSARTDKRSIKYIAEDANVIIDEIISIVPQQDALVLLFADPFNVHLKMSSLQKLTEKLRTDLLLHFPWGTYLQRVVSLMPDLKDETKQTIDEFFGTTDWRNLSHSTGVIEYIRLYENQLRKLGYLIGNNYPRMENSRKSTLYYLVFASKHQRGIEFWGKVNKIEFGGQRTLF